MSHNNLMNSIALIVAAGMLLQWLAASWRGVQARRRPRWQKAGPPATWPPVSVIVPAWRERGTLESCLEALADVDYPSFEVVVVAGGPDGTLDAAQAACSRDRRMRAIPQRPAGKNGAMNDGLRQTTGEIVVFLDADSRVSRNWLQELVAPLRGETMASTGNHVPLLATPVTQHERMRNVLEYEVRGRVMLQGSGSFALRREAFAIIGDFPEGVYADDWDLTWRLVQHGLARAFARDAIVCSERPATLREWYQNELRWRRIHLRSLFHLREAVFRTPISAGWHLLPYLTAWAGVALSVAAGASLLVPGLVDMRGHLVTLALVFWVWSVSGDLAMIGEATLYTRTCEWVRVAPLAPVLVAMRVVSCCVATMTSGSAPIQYQGPRRGRPATTEPEESDQQLVDVQYQ